jgi:hypothetical protein
LEEDAPTSVEEDPCAQVKANSFSYYRKVDLYPDCVIAHWKPSLGELSKAAEPQPLTE